MIVLSNAFRKIKPAGSILICVIFILHFQSCITTAFVEDVSSTSKVYDFDLLAKSEYIEKDEFSYKPKVTRYEYYLQTEVTIDSILIHAITNSLKAFRYKIKIIDTNENAIVGKKKSNDLDIGAVAGVYYKSGSISSEIYIQVKMASDFTGITGSRQINWSMDIGKQICRTLQQCTKSYVIKTVEQETDDEE